VLEPPGMCRWANKVTSENSPNSAGAVLRMARSQHVAAIVS
jgi:hypothetical protein